MVGAGAISETAVSADTGPVSGEGGATFSDEVGEVVASGDAISGLMAMAISLVERAVLSDLVAAVSSSVLSEGITGSIDLSVDYLPDGLWIAELADTGDWLAAPFGEDAWVVVTAGGDFWTKQ